MSQTRKEWIYTMYLPECQGTPCSKQVGYLKYKRLQQNSNPQPLSSSTSSQPFSQTSYIVERSCKSKVVVGLSHIKFNVLLKFNQMSVGFTMRNSFVWVKEERLSGWEKKRFHKSLAFCSNLYVPKVIWE